MSDYKNISPQNNNYLLGQDKAEALFLNSWKNNKLAHSWIISGPEGIGKATLAYRIARFLLWADKTNVNIYTSLSVPENSIVFRQVADKSHPDLRVIERDFIENDKKKIVKAINQGEALSDNDLSKLKKSNYIKIDDVREINEFLSKTSFNDGWRIVIIDSADDMNIYAANALLKILEEPPAQTILLLICHNLGNLLPTIRSRCAKLTLQSLSQDNVASLLRRYRPQLNEAQIKKNVELCEGSIGKAITYADSDAIGIYNDLCSIIYAKGGYSTQKLLDFCDNICNDEEKFSLSQELIIRFLKDNISISSDVEAIYNCWNETQKMFYACNSVNMDKKIMLINLINKICKAI